MVFEGEAFMKVTYLFFRLPAVVLFFIVASCPINCGEIGLCPGYEKDMPVGNEGLTLTNEHLRGTIGSPGAASCLVEANRLFETDVLSIGAPVNAVAWLCQKFVLTCSSCGTHVHNRDPLAALAGDSVDGADARVYALKGDRLFFVTSTSSGLRALSAAWCVIEGTPYLALGGHADEYGNNVKVFKLSPMCVGCRPHRLYELTCVGNFSHGAPVRSVAWLCHECPSGSGDYLLAIGGDAPRHDGASVRVLGFERKTSSLSCLGNFVHGAAINAVAWYTCIPWSYPLLAVGGQESPGENPVNIRLLSFACKYGRLVPVTGILDLGPCVTALTWLGGPCPQLITGSLCTQAGSSTAPTIAYYKFLPHKNSLVLSACNEVDDASCHSVDALALVPDSSRPPCSYLTAGLEMTDEDHNGAKNSDNAVTSKVLVYAREKRPTGSVCPRRLVPVAQSCRLDGTITSLAWCMSHASSTAYLLVGMGKRSVCGNEDPEHEGCTFKAILYKARFVCDSDRYEAPSCQRTADSIDDE